MRSLGVGTCRNARPAEDVNLLGWIDYPLVFKLLEPEQPREDPPPHGEEDGEGARRQVRYLTNITKCFSSLAVLAKTVRDCIVELVVSLSARVPELEELKQQPNPEVSTVESILGSAFSGVPRVVNLPRYDVPEEKLSMDAMRRRFEGYIEAGTGICVICRSEASVADGPLFKSCLVCSVEAHAGCWNQHLRDRVRINANSGQREPVPKRCPQCRDENVQTRAPYVKGEARIVLRNREVKDEDEYELKCGEGEEFVCHPWVLFMLKTPRQKVSGATPAFRLVHKVDNNTFVPVILRVMREDDEILDAFGPLFRVRSGTGPFWPMTWADPELIRRVGFSVIANLFRGADFNEDWCVERITTMISREKPQWEFCESEVRAWVRGAEAMDYYESVILNVVRRKDLAQKMKWMKLQISGDLSGAWIEFYYWCFKYMWFVRVGFVLFSCLIPVLVKNIMKEPDSVWLWILKILYSVLWYRFARLCGYLYITKMPQLKYLNALSIWKTCSDHVELPKLSPSAVLTCSPKVQLACPVEKAIEVYGCVIEKSPVVIPNGCCHDMKSAVCIRFIFDRVLDRRWEYALLEFAKEFLSRVKWAPWPWYSPFEWLEHLKVSRRKTLLLEDDGSAEDPKNWSADIFVKAEAYVGKTWEKFKPRMIQCRKSSLQIIIGPYFYSLYKWFAKSFAEGKDVYSVNLNALALGHRAFMSFGLGRVFEGDASNWDGSVTQRMLEIERWFLQFVVPFQPLWLKNLLLMWCKTEGSSKGVRYRCSWGRRSGDMWTSTFNTMLNIVITNFVWGPRLIMGTYNGDDNWFVVSECKGGEMQSYENVGLKMELVERFNWRELEFCSGKFYWTERGAKWGLKPFRQLCKFGINFGRHSKRKFKGLLYGNALSMLPIAGHVPIFGIFLRSIVSSARSRGVQAIELPPEEWMITDSVIDDIHPEEELEFKLRYGFNDSEYDSLKLWAENVSIEDFPMLLQDDMFLKGAQVDCGFVGSPVLSHKNHSHWVECDEKSDRTWLFPFVEEFVCYWFPNAWFMWGMFETALDGVYHLLGHFLLHQVRRQSSVSALLIHFLWNYIVYTYTSSNSLNMLQCVSLYQHCRSHWLRNLLSRNVRCKLTLWLRRPALFSAIPAFLGLCKYRVTGCSKAKSPLGLEEVLSLNRT